MGFEFESGRQQEMDISLKPGGLGGSLKEQTTSKIIERSEFASLLSLVRKNAGRKRAILVLDNFEQIIDDPELVRAVASIIISADEEAIASLGVKILIVGTPSNLRELVTRAGNANTISNRLIEIPEVARMTLDEAKSLISRAFDKLGYAFDVDKASVFTDICWKTDRIVQHIHELCLKVALGAERNGELITDKILGDAEKDWLEESFSADFSVIENVMNSRETKVGRKNQVIYSLGKIEREEFRHSDIEKVVREEFDVDASTSLNLPQMLAGFAGADNPLLRRGQKNNVYRFASPKLKMAIRTGLRRTEDQRISKYTE